MMLGDAGPLKGGFSFGAACRVWSQLLWESWGDKLGTLARAEVRVWIVYLFHLGSGTCRWDAFSESCIVNAPAGTVPLERV